MTDATKNKGITGQIYGIYDGISGLAAKGISTIKSNLQLTEHNPPEIPIYEKVKDNVATDLYNLTQSGINRLKKHVPLASSLLKDQSPYEITNTAGEVSEQDSTRQIVDFIIDEAATVIAGAKILVSPSEAKEYETQVIIEGTIAAVLGIGTAAAWALKRLSARGRAGDQKIQQYTQEILGTFEDMREATHKEGVKLYYAEALTAHIAKYFGDELLGEITDIETLLAIQAKGHAVQGNQQLQQRRVLRIQAKITKALIKDAATKGITLDQGQASRVANAIIDFLQPTDFVAAWVIDPEISASLAEDIKRLNRDRGYTPESLIVGDIFDGAETYFAATKPDENPWAIKGKFWAIITGLDPAPKALSFLEDDYLRQLFNDHRSKLAHSLPEDRVLEVYAHMFGTSPMDIFELDDATWLSRLGKLHTNDVRKIKSTIQGITTDLHTWLDDENASMRQLENILQRLDITIITIYPLFARDSARENFIEIIRVLAKKSFQGNEAKLETKIIQSRLFEKAKKAQEISRFVKNFLSKPTLSDYLQLFQLSSEDPSGDMIQNLHVAINTEYQVPQKGRIRGFSPALSHQAGQYLPSGYELPPLSEEDSNALTDAIRTIHALGAFFERGPAIATLRSDTADQLPDRQNPRDIISTLTNAHPVAYAFQGFDDEKRKSAKAELKAMMKQLNRFQKAHPEAFSYLMAEAEKTHPGMAEALGKKSARNTSIPTLLAKGEAAVGEYQAHINKTLESGSPQDAFYYIDRILRSYDLQDYARVGLAISYTKFLKKIESEESKLPEAIKNRLLAELPAAGSLQASQLEDVARARMVKRNAQKLFNSFLLKNNQDNFLNACTLFYLGDPSKMDQSEYEDAKKQFLTKMFEAIIASEGEIVISLELNSADGAGQRISISDPNVISALKGRAEDLLNKIPGGYQAPKPAPSPGNVFKIVPYRNRHALRR